MWESCCAFTITCLFLSFAAGFSGGFLVRKIVCVKRGDVVSYEVFCNKVKLLITKSGISKMPRFFIHDDGRYFAKCDGVTIVGNPRSQLVKVSWGYGQHMSSVRLT